jgi:hypothetical protein
MHSKQIGSRTLLAAAALVAASAAVAGGTEVAAAAPASVVPLVCTHPGFTNRGGSGHFLDEVGIRSGPNIACPLNGNSLRGDPAAYWCWVSSEGITWSFVVDLRNGVRGWVPDSHLSGNGAANHC